MSVKCTKTHDKILYYLGNLTREKIINISPNFGRAVSCPENCGGCCLKFSLDFYLGERLEKFKEEYPEEFKKMEFNGVYYTDVQEDNSDRWCRYLNKENGRCMIHNANPFSCEFELNKVIYNKRMNTTYVMTKKFGRGWNFTRTDGGVGALCEILPFSEKKFLTDIKLFEELHNIAKQINFETWLPEMLEYLNTNKEHIILQGGIQKPIIFKHNNDIVLF